ncbi:MAG: hypothetical protein WBA65_14220 [Rhodanobacter sp.]|uniref:hypothetical protein n=1 Tax=Castellaniella sp. TaxID=1955812 RepID=UPI003C795DCA
MKLDRNLQHTILERLAELYPNRVDWAAIASWPPEHNMPGHEGKLRANLDYLAEHQLIKLFRPTYLEGKGTGASITARGLDFLADDGGLSAILGVVTIKFHDDTLKDLIEAKILASDLPQPDKKRWTDQLRSLPAETTKHLTLKLVDMGLASGPAAIAAIGKFLAGS